MRNYFNTDFCLVCLFVLVYFPCITQICCGVFWGLFFNFFGGLWFVLLAVPCFIPGPLNHLLELTQLPPHAGGNLLYHSLPGIDALQGNSTNLCSDNTFPV